MYDWSSKPSLASAPKSFDWSSKPSSAVADWSVPVAAAFAASLAASLPRSPVSGNKLFIMVLS